MIIIIYTIPNIHLGPTYLTSVSCIIGIMIPTRNNNPLMPLTGDLLTTDTAVLVVVVDITTTPALQHMNMVGIYIAAGGATTVFIGVYLIASLNVLTTDFAHFEMAGIVVIPGIRSVKMLMLLLRLSIAANSAHGTLIVDLAAECSIARDIAPSITGSIARGIT